MENVKEVLKLSVEQKGVLVPVGELTVYLDGLTVTGQEELAPLTNGNAANGTSELIIYVFGEGDAGGCQFSWSRELVNDNEATAEKYATDEYTGPLSPNPCTVKHSPSSFY